MARKEREWGSGWLMKRGRVYIACWKYNGKVYRRTTKTTNQREAEARLDEYVSPFKAARAGRHAEAVAEVVSAGEERVRREMANLPALMIRDAYTVLEYIVTLHDDKGNVVTDKDEKPKLAISPMTLIGYKHRLDEFCKWLNNNRVGGDGVEMREIGLESIKAFLKAKVNEGVTIKTRQQIAMKLKKTFQRIADAEGVRTSDKSALDQMTFAGKPLSRLNEIKVEHRWWCKNIFELDECKAYHGEVIAAQSCGRKPLTRDELHRLLDNTDNATDVWLLLRIGAQTGLRLGDCANLKFGTNVRLNEGRTGRVVVSPSKTGTRSLAFVDTALGEELHRIISALPNAGKDGEYLMPRLHDLYNNHPSLVAQLVTRAFIDAGFEVNVEIGSGIRRRSVYGFHSLRYTVAGVMASSGVNLETAAGALAHSNISTTRGYFNKEKTEEQREAEASAWAAWYNGTADASAFKQVTAGAISREAVADNQLPVYDAVCAMLKGLKPETLKAVASEALRLAMANHATKVTNAANVASSAAVA